MMDADALYHVSQSDLKGLPKNKSVITPHFQEFKTLFRGVNLSSSEKNVAEAVKRIQEVVILKGNGSLIGVGETVYKNQTGSSALATAGSGDVLTGLIVGLMAQGVSVEESARLGVFLHGLAGDLAEADLGTHSVIASDIILHISAAFKALIG